MAIRGTQSAPIELKAVDSAYPLYGKLRLADGRSASAPPADTAWIGAALAERLGMATGDTGPGGQVTGGTGGTVVGGDGGGAGTPGQFTVQKQYVLEQGTNLSVSTSDGLLVYSGADARDWTNVTRSSRDAECESGQLGTPRERVFRGDLQLAAPPLVLLTAKFAEAGCK